LKIAQLLKTAIFSFLRFSCTLGIHGATEPYKETVDSDGKYKWKYRCEICGKKIDDR